MAQKKLVLLLTPLFLCMTISCGGDDGGSSAQDAATTDVSSGDDTAVVDGDGNDVIATHDASETDAPPIDITDENLEAALRADLGFLAVSEAAATVADIYQVDEIATLAEALEETTSTGSVTLFDFPGECGEGGIPLRRGCPTIYRPKLGVYRLDFGSGCFVGENDRFKSRPHHKQVSGQVCVQRSGRDLIVHFDKHRRGIGRFAPHLNGSIKIIRRGTLFEVQKHADKPLNIEIGDFADQIFDISFGTESKRFTINFNRAQQRIIIDGEGTFTHPGVTTGRPFKAANLTYHVPLPDQCRCPFDGSFDVTGKYPQVFPGDLTMRLTFDSTCGQFDITALKSDGSPVLTRVLTRETGAIFNLLCGGDRARNYACPEGSGGCEAFSGSYYLEGVTVGPVEKVGTDEMPWLPTMFGAAPTRPVDFCAAAVQAADKRLHRYALKLEVAESCAATITEDFIDRADPKRAVSAACGEVTFDSGTFTFTSNDPVTDLKPFGNLKQLLMGKNAGPDDTVTGFYDQGELTTITVSLSNTLRVAEGDTAAICEEMNVLSSSVVSGALENAQCVIRSETTSAMLDCLSLGQRKDNLLDWFFDGSPGFDFGAGMNQGDGILDSTEDLIGLARTTTGGEPQTIDFHLSGPHGSCPAQWNCPRTVEPGDMAWKPTFSEVVDQPSIERKGRRGAVLVVGRIEAELPGKETIEELCAAYAAFLTAHKDQLSYFDSSCNCDYSCETGCEAALATLCMDSINEFITNHDFDPTTLIKKENWDVGTHTNDVLGHYKDLGSLGDPFDFALAYFVNTPLEGDRNFGTEVEEVTLTKLGGSPITLQKRQGAPTSDLMPILNELNGKGLLPSGDALASIIGSKVELEGGQFYIAGAGSTTAFNYDELSSYTFKVAGGDTMPSYEVGLESPKDVNVCWPPTLTYDSGLMPSIRWDNGMHQFGNSIAVAQGIRDGSISPRDIPWAQIYLSVGDLGNFLRPLTVNRILLPHPDNGRFVLTPERWMTFTDNTGKLNTNNLYLMNVMITRTEPVLYQAAEINGEEGDFVLAIWLNIAWKPVFIWGACNLFSLDPGGAPCYAMANFRRDIVSYMSNTLTCDEFSDIDWP